MGNGEMNTREKTLAREWHKIRVISCMQQYPDVRLHASSSQIILRDSSPISRWIALILLTIKRKYILILVERFSSYIHAYPCL